MANENLKALVKKSRTNVAQNNIGVDAPVNFRFGESVYFTNDGIVNGLFQSDDNGDQVEGVDRSIFSDATLNNRGGFLSIIDHYIDKNKRG